MHPVKCTLTHTEEVLEFCFPLLLYQKKKKSVIGRNKRWKQCKRKERSENASAACNHVHDSRKSYNYLGNLLHWTASSICLCLPLSLLLQPWCTRWCSVTSRPSFSACTRGAPTSTLRPRTWRSSSASIISPSHWRLACRSTSRPRGRSTMASTCGR